MEKAHSASFQNDGTHVHWAFEPLTCFTFLIHPVDPQLTTFIGPTAVHQVCEGEEQAVGPSCCNLGYSYSSQSTDDDGWILHRHLLPQAQLTVTI